MHANYKNTRWEVINCHNKYKEATGTHGGSGYVWLGRVGRTSSKVSLDLGPQGLAGLEQQKKKKKKTIGETEQHSTISKPRGHRSH